MPSPAHVPPAAPVVPDPVAASHNVLATAHWRRQRGQPYALLSVLRVLAPRVGLPVTVPAAVLVLALADLPPAKGSCCGGGT